MSPTTASDLVGRVNRDLERSVLRARNGLRYVRGTHRPKLGATPKDIVWKRDKVELWRYRGGPVRFEQPLLVVTSLVSRSYILDLLPGSSTVEYLRRQGFDVFMVDWGVPDHLDADNSLETYIDEYLPRVVDAVIRETGAEELTMVGYCLGGVLATLYVNGHDDGRARNLVLLATPVDFRAMGPMVAALQEGRLEPDDIIDETGNVPADVLYTGFFMMAPTTVVAQNATLLENLWNDEFVRGFQAVSQWTRDQVPFPGAAFRQVVEDLIRRNRLMGGTIRIGAREIDVSTSAANVLNAMAEKDRIVPRAAAEPVGELVGRPEHRDVMILTGGHATFGTGRSAFKHTLPRLADWIASHSDARDATGGIDGD